MIKRIVSVSLLLGLTSSLNAASYGGQHYSFFKTNSNGYGISYPNTTGETFDEDNPDFLTLMFESDKQKANRETRISIKDNIYYIFSEIIPKYEQDLWMVKNKEISKIGAFGEVYWRPIESPKQLLIISYENVGDNPDTKYKTLSEYLSFYKKLREQNVNRKVSFTILSQNNDAAVVFIEQVDRGASDQTKQNTQVKSIEKWMVSGDWLIGMGYSNRLEGDPEKNAAWPEIQKTWENRFAKINFSSEPKN